MSKIVQAKGVGKPSRVLQIIRDRAKAIFKELDEGSSDRSACVLAAAYVDELLDAIIRKVLLPRRKDERLGHPSQNLASKIELCRRLGLIFNEVADALDEIRHLRNAFAHRTNLPEALSLGGPASGPSLADKPHSDRVNRLAKHVEAAGAWKDFSLDGGKTARESFLKSVAGVVIELEVRLLRAERVGSARKGPGSPASSSPSRSV